jgi:hypothetical protein
MGSCGKMLQRPPAAITPAHNAVVLQLRYARWDLARIDLLDPHTEQPVAVHYPLEKHRNAERGRRALAPVNDTAPVGAMPATNRTRHGMAPLLATPALEDFAWRIEHTHVREGGFALITGVPGTGKSVALRNRWLAHLDASLMRPALLIDEARELAPAVLRELRLLASSQFDSSTLLSLVLAGDQRLTEPLRRDDLLPLGPRIRARMALEHASRDDLLACLAHLTASAGDPVLLNEPLAHALADQPWATTVY